MTLYEQKSTGEVVVHISDPKDEETTDIHHIHVPLNLKFENLNVKAGEKTILRGISGEFKPGELVAIMGPSGAGKSTLLNFLAGREKGMELESGEILINNQKSTKALRRRIGYVMQEDIFFSHLTVDQTLKFVGEIRLPDSYSIRQKHKIVNEVIDELGLTKCVDTVMGGGMFVTGCSGGEKKRCSIATELITNPSMIMMDEPTSGLDSSTAFNLINTLKKLANDENRTIVTTIHQPSSHVFHMFDKLLLIADGKVAYFGKTCEVMDFFEFLGMPCHQNWNPADFIMEKLTMDSDLKEVIADKFVKFKSLHKKEEKQENKDGQNGTEVNEKIDEQQLNGNAGAESDADNDSPIQRWPTGFRTQFSALSKRAFIQSRKDVLDRFGLIQTVVISLITGLLWWDTPYDEASLYDRQGVIFFVVVFLMLNPMFFALMSFPTERDAIAKERAAGMYRLSAYYTAKLVSEVPVVLVQPLLFYVIYYWMSGLNRSAMFLVGALSIAVGTILAHSIGLIIGGAIKVFKKAITFTIIFALTSMLLAGFYTKRIPFWLEWAKYTSHIAYAYNILIRVEFEYASKDFRCGIKSVYNACENNGTYLTGKDILPGMASIDVDIIESFAILLGMIVFCQTAFYFVMKYLNKPN